MYFLKHSTIKKSLRNNPRRELITVQKGSRINLIGFFCEPAHSTEKGSLSAYPREGPLPLLILMGVMIRNPDLELVADHSQTFISSMSDQDILRKYHANLCTRVLLKNLI